jgi:lauroyl/myristoyl acyltransferase
VVSKELGLYRAGAFVATTLPAPAACALARRLGSLVGRLPDYDGRRAVVASHMARVLGRAIAPPQARRMVADVFANYGRYWAESLRLPSVPADEVVAGVTTEGEEHVDAGLAEGRGVIIAAPHLGGWEWGARYLVSRGLGVTAAVEALRPADVFDWFAGFRRRLGMNVVPVGPGASAAILQALADNHVVCLLSDRRVGDTSGVQVSFFGEQVELPAGPVTLSVRSGAPVVPAAIFFGSGADAHHIVFRPALSLPYDGRLRDTVQKGTQALAWELEDLVRRAPTQWHIVQPNWPGDPQLHGVAAWARPAPPGAARGGRAGGWRGGRSGAG